MKKLKLDLDQLSVESFDTAPTRSGQPDGTVKGFATLPEIITCFTCDATCSLTCELTCDDPTCSTCNGNTCEGTCGGHTCNGTCGENTCNGCNTQPWDTCPSCPYIICE